MAQLFCDPCHTARLTLCDTHPACVGARLAAFGVRYARLDLPVVAFDAEAGVDEIVGNYLEPLNAVTTRLSCAQIDVLSVLPSHPRLASVQREFMTEHWHGTAESQLMVHGGGVLFMRVADAVFALRCGPGDFVRLPPRLCHWFALDAATGVRTIRLFEERPDSADIGRGRDMRKAYRLMPAANGTTSEGAMPA